MKEVATPEAFERDRVVKEKAGRFCLAWWTSLPCESHGFSENVNTCQLTKKTP